MIPDRNKSFFFKMWIIPTRHLERKKKKNFLERVDWIIFSFNDRVFRDNLIFRRALSDRLDQTFYLSTFEKNILN